MHAKQQVLKEGNQANDDDVLTQPKDARLH
jgi:hypothetical protein